MCVDVLSRCETHDISPCLEERETEREQTASKAKQFANAGLACLPHDDGSCEVQHQAKRLAATSR